MTIYSSDYAMNMDILANKPVLESHSKTTTPEYIKFLKDKAQAKRDRKQRTK